MINSSLQGQLVSGGTTKEAARFQLELQKMIFAEEMERRLDELERRYINDRLAMEFARRMNMEGAP